ncbi:Cell filamentation protein [Deinococcus marmoris]|uniref:protein adenylyltransferase n=2 Tax=Deinococcus marmoris TaxID=249408 RepID=A0A1U7NW23_9DEIO|nr:Cell filamentation protein [Deinococcus marmoris]
MAGLDPYTGDNGVMKNRLGIQDAGELSQAERKLASIRAVEIKDGSAPAATRGHFDADHLRAIHQHTFQDVYEWAGTTRGDDLTLEGQREQQPVQLIKAQTSFEEGPKVNAKLDSLFARLAEQDGLRSLSREDFSRQAADVLSDLNQVHPFREGNGRTQREFMIQLAEQAGHPLQFEAVTQQRMTVVSFDAAQGDKDSMRRLFDEITDPDRARVLQRGFDSLHGRYGEQVQAVYLTSTTAGETYAGQLQHKDRQHFIMNSTGDTVVGHPQDLPKGSSPGEVVKVTATPMPSAAEERQMQRGRSMGY